MRDKDFKVELAIYECLKDCASSSPECFSTSQIVLGRDEKMLQEVKTSLLSVMLGVGGQRVEAPSCV